MKFDWHVVKYNLNLDIFYSEYNSSIRQNLKISGSFHGFIAAHSVEKRSKPGSLVKIDFFLVKSVENDKKPIQNHYCVAFYFKDFWTQV